MATPPIGWAQANARLRLAGDNELMICTWGMKADGEYDQTRANGVSELASVFFKGILPSTMTYEGVTIDVGADGGTIQWSSTQGNGVGANGSGNIPSNSALLFDKRSARAGRKGRGRMFVPGVPANVVTSLGQLTGAMVTLCTTRANAFLTGLDTSLNTMAILHGDPTDSPEIVTSFQVQQFVATQRRRLR